MTGRLVTQKGLDLILGATTLLGARRPVRLPRQRGAALRARAGRAGHVRARPDRRAARLHRPAGAPAHGGRRHLPHAVAVRAVRPHPDAGAALRRAAGRAPGRRAGRHGRGRRDRLLLRRRTRPRPSRRPRFRALDRVSDIRPSGRRWCAGAWRATSAGSARWPRTSMSTAARWSTRAVTGELRADGLRPHAAQPPAVRAEPRALAARQRLDLRGGGRHLPAAARDAPRASRADGVPAPVTIGFTPVLANQLAQPGLRRRSWRRSSSSGSRPATRRPASLAASGDSHLLPLVELLARRGCSGSASCSTSIGRRPHRRVPRARGGGPARDHRLGGDPRLPAAARPGREHPAPARGRRRRAPPALRARARGLLAAGVRLPAAGPLGALADRAAHRRAAGHRGASRRRGLPVLLRRRPPGRRRARRSASTAIRRATPRCIMPRAAERAARNRSARRTAPTGSRSARRAVAAFVRDPRASMQVWSRFRATPATSAYLEFHKMRWPGGLKLWRVTGPGVGPRATSSPTTRDGRRPGARATPITSPTCSTASPRPSAEPRSGVIVAPFDTELFGHWWFEGPDFLGDVYRALRGSGDGDPRRRPARGTSTTHPPPRGHPAAVRAPGAPTATSACGSATSTAWTWERLWPLEERFWDAAPGALADAGARAGAGAGGARAAAGPVLRLAVHHLHRRRGRLRRAALPGALRRRRAADRGARPGREATSRRPSGRAEELDQRDAALPRRAARGRRRARRLPLTRGRLTMAPIRFVFGLHLHQPVGNFDHVFEQHVEDVYRPAARASRPTGISSPSSCTSPARCSSGWRSTSAPTSTSWAGWCATGKIELLLAGFYEPVLASLPRADRVEQIQWMRDAVRRRFGVDARGLWLTERVWEPELAADLADAGVRYALVDDRHFLVTGFARRAAARALLDRERRQAGRALPDRRAAPLPDPVPAAGGDGRTTCASSAARGHRLAVLADDGEKFGGWPGTKEWVYEQRLAGPVHRHDRRAGRERRGAAQHGSTTRSTPCRAAGIAYLPTASYREMEGWSLPPDAALRLTRLERDLGEARLAGPDGALVRGAHWRNFLVKYSESNRMHKKMHGALRCCAARRGDPADGPARDRPGAMQRRLLARRLRRPVPAASARRDLAQSRARRRRSSAGARGSACEVAGPRRRRPRRGLGPLGRSSRPS